LSTTQQADDLTWRVVLDTGRFGDWIFVTAPDEDAARRKLTPSQRRKVGYIQRVYRTSERHLMPTPRFKKRR
jgi:hypothetical protein